MRPPDTSTSLTNDQYNGNHYPSWKTCLALQTKNSAINHPTVDNPMRPPDTSTSLTNDQYNGNHYPSWKTCLALQTKNSAINHPTVDNPMRPPDTSTSLTNDQYNGNHYPSWKTCLALQTKNSAINHPTVVNPMRPPDTSTSLKYDQYNGNHAHSIISEEIPLNANSAEQSINNQNNNDDCYMKECYCGKLCKELKGLKAHQRSCKVLDLHELREMFQQPLLQKVIVNESDNISDNNNSDNEADNEDLRYNVVLKGLKLPRSKEEWDSVSTHFKNNMAIQMI